MSNQENKTVTASEFGIVNKIRAFLKLDEAGRIEKFFQKEVQKAKNNIRDIKNNISALTNVFESAVQKLEDKIEDAKEAVAAAYQAITLENVSSNEVMAQFAERYWANIDSKERALKSIENQLKDLKEAHEKEIKEQNEQVAKWQSRIDVIVKK